MFSTVISTTALYMFSIFSSTAVIYVHQTVAKCNFQRNVWHGTFNVISKQQIIRMFNYITNFCNQNNKIEGPKHVPVGPPKIFKSKNVFYNAHVGLSIRN